MTESKELAFQYDTVEGPEGLREVLDSYLVKSQKDPSFAQAIHYILYTLGNQRSLIRVDTSQNPFYFGYCDLLGRPATRSIKETIAAFLWEKCGEEERYTKALTARERT